jgi:surfactin synthase thioesterase subunit
VTTAKSQICLPGTGGTRQQLTDQPEVFASLAPRAVLVVGRDQDHGMPVEGLKRLEQEVKAAYARRGATDHFAVHITAGDHTYTEEMFEQVSQWFRRFLKR